MLQQRIHMPELPEVEAAKLLLLRHCKHTTIVWVEPTEGGGGPRSGEFDDVVVGEGVSPERLRGALCGRSICDVHRKGKQLWLELGGEGPHLLLHFGMTGALVVDGVTPLQFKAFKVQEGATTAWPPRYSKLQLECSNGTRLAFTDPRRLGRILLRACPAAENPIAALGPDPVSDPPDADAFAAALAVTSTPIKAALLDQQRAVSGVGNWLADEILHAAAVHPAAVCSRLSSAQVAAVFSALREVTARACAVEADSSRFPQDWLFHVRWGRNAKPGSSRTLTDGRRVAFITVAGRTTATVPARQGRSPSYGSSSSRRSSTTESDQKTIAAAGASGGGSKRCGTQQQASTVQADRGRGEESAPARPVAPRRRSKRRRRSGSA